MTTYNSNGAKYTIDSDDDGVLVPIKIAIMGTAGTGKTFGALTLAYGMAEEIEKMTGNKQKIGVVDTENKSALLYRSSFQNPKFTHIGLEKPFTVDAYIETISVAEEMGINILVIDSTSHAWKRILEEKEKADQKGGNSFANWSAFKKKFQQLTDAILQSPMHIICTMRSKTEYVQNKDANGRTTVQKKGMAAIQEPEIEYEFTLFLEALNTEDNYSTAKKDRTGLWADGRQSKIIRRDGQAIVKWLASGNGAVQTPNAVTETSEKKDKLRAESFNRIVTSEGFPYEASDKDGIRGYLANLAGKNVPFSKYSEITQDELDTAYIEFNKRVEGLALVKGALGTEGKANTTEDALDAVNSYNESEYDDVYLVTSADWNALLDNFESYIKGEAVLA